MNKLLVSDQTNKIDKVDSITDKEFLTNYALKSKPVLLTGIIDNWKATKEWSFDYFKEKYGDTIITIHTCRPPTNTELYETSLGEYIDYIKKGDFEDNPWYCDWTFTENTPEISEEYQAITAFGDNWIDNIPKGILNEPKWIYIGPKGSGTSLHIDFCMTSAWNAVIVGQKKWAFFSPDQAPYLYDGEVDVFNPDFEKFPLFKKAQPIIVTQKAGEVMYTPSGWWHQVVNEESGISITENYINSTNADVSLWPYLKSVIKKNDWNVQD
ncbi:cupin-like domain-containing protein [Bacillus mycoides]|uniref:cupin-like domain-containing protein n=1 Tax=Bacillus mycoides TaxID=1405 RepID=UPI000871B938|nr:cupin-like domain-containing protein [Bacillus mycoides]OFD69124.1 hypothetical protein BWGOE9_59390 [Bacillus mycoides]OFD71261.1 hypothetical protein BWGOE10_56750 [Bacillus mycoides]